MKDDRLRFSLEDEYAKSLGRALFVFSALEWNAAHCCEKISPGYLNNLKKKTAGIIADDLINLVATMRPQVWTSHEGTCRQFKTLVELRNRIMHGKAGTAPNGDQRLIDKGTVMDAAFVDDAADQFAACSTLVRDKMYDQL